MGSVNKVILLGRLGADPELRYTGGGQPVANFRIATTERIKRNENWEERTEWHRVVVWGKLAENCSQYLSKGREVYVEGRLQTRQWNDQNGNTRYTTEIVAREVVFLSGGRQQNGPGQSAGPQAYLEALNRAGASLARSLVYAGVGASLLTLLGFFTGYVIQTRALGCWRSVDSLTLFLFALPSTVIGIGLVSLWNTPWTNLVYATPLIIILGYLAKYTALTSRICVAQFAQIPRSMEEAAQVAGVGWFHRVAFILAPLARRGLLGAWIVGYIFCFRDTGITMLVYPAGHDTLPVRIFTLMANGSQELIAALSVSRSRIRILTLWTWSTPASENLPRP